jgi:hypothetical protein
VNPANSGSSAPARAFAASSAPDFRQVDAHSNRRHVAGKLGPHPGELALKLGRAVRLASQDFRVPPHGAVDHTREDIRTEDGDLECVQHGRV